MNHTTRSVRCAIIGLACAGGAAPWTRAQSPQPAPDRQPAAAPHPAEPAEQAGPQARERVRGFIEAQLRATREQQQRLERALKMLDDGVPLRDIRREVGESPRDRAEAGHAAPPGPDARFEAPDDGRGPGEPDVLAPGGPGAPGALGGPPAQGDLPPDQGRQLMEVLADTNPRLHERVAWLMSHEPPMGRAALLRAAPRLRELAQLRERDPEAYGLKKQEIALMREAFDVLRSLHETPPEGRTTEKIDAVKAQLAQVVNRQFDLRMEIRARELKQAEDRLEKIHAEVDAASDQREALVQQRVDDMVRHALEGPRKGPRDDDGASPHDDAPGGPPAGGPRPRFRDRGQPDGGQPPSRPPRQAPPR